MAARFARRQRGGGGGSEALGRGVGGSTPPPPLLAMPGLEQGSPMNCLQGGSLGGGLAG